MAFDGTQLWNVNGMPPGKAKYVYYEDDDTRETVMASGYFNNTDDNLNMASDDTIEVRGNQGGYTLRVDTVSSGTVTTELTGQSIWLTGRIADLSATASHFVVSPCDGVISRVKVVQEGTINVDTTVGLEIANTNVTDGGSADIVTLESSGDAAGSTGSGTADGANAVSEGTAIEITCGGEGSSAAVGIVLIEIIPA